MSQENSKVVAVLPQHGIEFWNGAYDRCAV